jgi:hypothetical protein
VVGYCDGTSGRSGQPTVVYVPAIGFCCCVRFLVAMREGRVSNPSAGQPGIGKATGYRWLRDAQVS